MANILDHLKRRMRAFDLENYVLSMFTTESYSFATVMHKDFAIEMAHMLTQQFERADHQTRKELAFKPCLPQSLKVFPSIQQEVNGQACILPEVINLVSDDEKEMDENKVDDDQPPSEHHKGDEDKKDDDDYDDDDDDDDDDDAPTPGAEGIAQGQTASSA